MKYKLGELASNFTIIKDGVDLKDRFHNVLDNHPLTYHWSDGVKSMIALKFYDEVMKDSNVNNDKECCGRWREKIEFKNVDS